MIGVASYPAQALDYESFEGQYVGSPQVVEVETKRTFQFPLASFSSVSQGFNKYHAGTDLRAPKGTAVVPVAKGHVITSQALRTGYGKYVVVAHDNGFVTLYAHLDKIFVEQGDNVSRDTVLGEVGTTGWTTGPHLHFEMMQHGVRVNPAQYVAYPGK